MKITLVLSLFLLVINIKSQDTIFVYDTIYIYDTISIEKDIELTRFDNRPIIKYSDTLKNNDTLSATFLKKDIIVDETIKKIKEMKKVNLFGVMIIALQSITLAQHDLGIKLGISGFGTTDNVKEVSNPFTSGFNVGVFYVHNFNEKTGLEIGVNYLYNNNNKTATSTSTTPSNLKYKQLFNNETNSVNSFSITKYKSQIAIPILVNFKLKKLTPNIGLEYRYKTYRETSVYESFISDIGIKAGVKKSITENIKIDLSYYQGLTNEQGVYQDTKLRSYSLSASLILEL